MKDRPVRRIEDDGTFVGLHRSTQKSLSPEMICDDHVTCEFGTNPFHQAQESKVQGVLSASELAHIKLWQNVMNVQNDRRAPQARHEGAEDEKVGDGMDVNQIVFTFEVMFRNLIQRPHEE